jgi:DNA-binding transcriptional ArsR family regulator
LKNIRFRDFALRQSWLNARHCDNLALLPYSTNWLTIDQAHCTNLAMTHPLDTTFAALADPTRRMILSMLLEDDMAVTDVAAPFSTSLAAISKHLQVLADAGLISQEKRGRVKWCKLEPDALRAASVWMQGFGQFEPVNLDAFERFLATELEGHDPSPEL